MVLMVPQEEKATIVIFTHISKNDKGYILLDTIIALLILSLTLTHTYSFFIRGFKLERKLNDSIEVVLEKGNSYDEDIKKLFQE